MRPSLSTTLFFFVFHALPAFAQTPTRLVPSNVNADQDYGYSVDLDGDVAVVGAFRNDNGIILESGAAFVFRFNGSNWVEETALEPEPLSSLNWFGWDVAVSENVILSSTRFGDTHASNAGEVTVFRRANGAWIEEAKLAPTIDIVGDYGFALDVDGNVAAVGDPANNAVHVFRYNGSGWMAEAVLEAPNPGIQDQYGTAISIDGDRMLVGAFNADDDTSNQAGKLYVYDYDGSQWQETAVLVSSLSNNIANLGASVSLDGDWAVGGAPLDREGYGSTSGAALVYRYDGVSWNFHSKLFATDGPGFFIFGSSVAVSGSRLVVGADNWFPPAGGGTGKGYLFEYDATLDEWVPTEVIVPDNLPQGATFGHDVAMQGDVMLFGAPEFDGDLAAMGAAFIYGQPMVATAVEDEQPAASFHVSAPYPNPFSTSASVMIESQTGAPVSVALYDVLGREVKSVFSGRLPAGSSSVDVEAGDLPSGLYWLRIQTGMKTTAQSITLLR